MELMVVANVMAPDWLSPERELLITAAGDLIGCSPEMRAIAVIAQYAANGPALDVTVHASLP